MKDTHCLRLLIIGGVAAGTKAASKARRDNPQMSITIITEEPFISYAGCGLAYYVGGIVADQSHLIARTPDVFRDKQQIDIRTGHRATSIDTVCKMVHITILEDGSAYSLPYDCLLIATGSTPVIPPVPGIDADGVFALKTITDAERIISYIKTGKVNTAGIIGGGYIAAEVAENLTVLGISCTIFERAAHMLPRLFDADMAQHVEQGLRSHAVDVRLSTMVSGIETDSNGMVCSIIVGEKQYDCDMVILATGVMPNVSLAKAARIALGPTGAIRVDARMETSTRDIYAAGDCVESVNMISGKSGWYPLGSTANKQGRVAGTNIAGGEAVFDGVVGTAITKIFDIAAGRSGLSELECVETEFEPVAVTITSPDIPGYYPGGGEVSLKLIADSHSGRVLGAQAVGTGAVDKVIDTVATALTGGLSIGALVNLDTAYAPPYARAIGIVHIAAAKLEEMLIKKRQE